MRLPDMRRRETVKLTSKQRRYLERKFRRPRKTTPAMRAAIARQWFAREKTQMELALQWDVSQATVARIVAGTVYRDASIKQASEPSGNQIDCFVPTI